MALPDYTGQKWSTYKHQYTGPKPNDRLRRDYCQAKRSYISPQTTTPTLPPQHPGYQGPVQGPQTNSQHPFFDPNSNYAQTGRQYGQLPGGPGSSAINIYGTDVNPEGYYYATLNERGLGGLDARSQAAQGMYRDAALGYQAAKTKNMELWFPEYLEQWNPENVLNQMSNTQLGIDDSRIQGRDRWGMRGGM